MEEEEITELSDNELENVAGGKGWLKKHWKKVAVGVGIGLVVGAAVLTTGGVAALAAGGANAALTYGVCGFIASGFAVAGTGAIIAGSTL